MLNDNFCSSPWFHIRINSAGNYKPCRWIAFQKDGDNEYNISNTSILEYINSTQMNNIRSQLLNGDKLPMCSWCHHDDSVNKVSGRKLQLLKSGISTVNFNKTFCSSPHYKLFEYSYTHQGQTDYTPVDLQIDLGNTCNGACIMCSPTYSSKLAPEYVRLAKLEPKLFEKFTPLENWTEDPKLVEKFINGLADLPNIKYIHFLGGETLYLKSFYNICNRLIERGLAKDISIGTTTNCSVYNDELDYIIKNFKHVHLGLSIENFHKLNDYIRWPSDIDQVTENIQKFIKLRQENNIHLSLRITPNIFSIFHIDTIFEFMLNNRITAESCTVLREPSCLRVELLPADLVEICANKLNLLIAKYNLTSNDATVLNRRHSEFVDDGIVDTIFEFKYLFENMQAPTNVEEQRRDLVKFIRAFEQVHNNTILDYLPEYEEFLRSYGY